MAVYRNSCAIFIDFALIVGYEKFALMTPFVNFALTTRFNLPVEPIYNPVERFFGLDSRIMPPIHLKWLKTSLKCKINGIKKEPYWLFSLPHSSNQLTVNFIALMVSSDKSVNI